MEQDNIFQILVEYGRILGLSTAEMEKISADLGIANNNAETDSLPESILAVADGRDPRILWIGAVLYGYALDASAAYVQSDAEGRQ